MIADIFKVAVTAFVLALPLAIINATMFHNKADPRENMPSFVRRVAFSATVGFAFSVIVTHVALTLKDVHGGSAWPYYVAGFFSSVPYFMKSLAKQCRHVDHVVDGIGIGAAVIGFVLVILLWGRFFSIPVKAGFLYEISSMVRDL
jgi:hypothetical protein